MSASKSRVRACMSLRLIAEKKCSRAWVSLLMNSTLSLYEAIGGEAGVLRLAHAWHQRVLADEIVAHAFSHGFHPKHTERLAAYWGEAWGGPAAFSGKLGSESSVVRMHSGNGPHHEMDQRAIECF